MQWFSAISEKANTAEALDELAAQARAALGRPDLVLVFASSDHMAAFADLPAELLLRLPARALVGCSGAGIVGGGHEIEHREAVALTAARLPEVTLATLRLRDDDLPEDAAAWQQRLGIAAGADPCFVLLPDPFSFDVERCVRGLSAAYPQAPIIGGLASGASHAGGHALFRDHESYGAGAVLLAMHGNVVLEPIIAQGCKPIGDTMLVTSCEGRLVRSLGGRLPGDVLRELHTTLDDNDRLLMRSSLFIGIEMKDQREYRAGDFLIRNIMGLDPDGRVLAVAAELEPYKAVQFHVRDRAASATDLVQQLARFAERPRATQPAGALLFSCVGRGEHLYEAADHDSGCFFEQLGPLPLGGFFCNGEIGPVGDRTFVHGYTSAFGVFRPRR